MKFIQTTRTQLWIGFASVMLTVLICVSFVSYTYVSKLLLSNADRYSEEIASQATGRLEALLNQIDTITLQVNMLPQVQYLLTTIKAKRPVNIDEQLYLREPIIRLSSYLKVIRSVDVYSLDRAVYPADNTLLTDRIDPKWIAEADKHSGQLVWIGLEDSRSNGDNDSIVGIRQIRLESDNYRKGGYIVITANSSLLDFLGGSVASIEGSAMYLLNANGETISARQDGSASVPTEVLLGDDSEVKVNGASYKLIRKPAGLMGWTLVMQLPLSKITEGIGGLNRVYWLIGAVGLLFFVILSFILSTWVTRPIIHLIKVMRRTRDGVFRENPESYSNREMNELNFTYNKMVSNINQLIDEVYTQEIVRMTTEIKALQAQIHPHFLYNTLEAFYWSLIQKGEDELASKVLSLSNLFRYVIKQEKSGAHLVSLETEMSHVSSYLEIMGMRMGSRLGWQLTTEPATASLLIPKLLIQPIVENAILHGIEPNIGPGCVTVRSRLDEDGRTLIIAVEDTGTGLVEEEVEAINDKLQKGEPLASKRTGIGLHNISRLIRIYYGDSFGVSLRSKLGRGTLVELRLPAADYYEEGAASAWNK
ncbi:HAMP domain-containing protein [Cohnella sp. CFH 77786]|uniref:cache domain-containing sensor histidine kinase n=1 Tax=Cohnella sp. CFH 77786 TaxID=2662265 RepID=UPI001C60F865|nr:sensor histidine kinase [Cohnella sp. CFH 77786]MBW5449416.1 HAMP domain-containing protein [Cohnella sp. CFH 77786]